MTIIELRIFFRVNFSTLYREVFAALIDAMHRKFDKNAQLSNQLKTWDHSIRIIDKLLSIAKIADVSRVFFFYLKVIHHFKLFFHDKVLIDIVIIYFRIHICTSSYSYSME